MPCFSRGLSLQSLHHLKQRVLRGLVCVCAATPLLLAGCSSMQLAYKNAPLLAQYQLDRYFDLNDEQEQLLKTELAQLRQWHQSQALPIYAQTLRQWSQELARPHTFSAQEILDKQQQLQEAVLLFAHRASSTLSPVLQTLSERQKQQLVKRFEASNAEFRQNFLADPQQARELRRERMIKNYERWLGSLTPEQWVVLSDWMEQNPNNTQRWAQERLFRQAALLDIIAQAPQYATREQAANALEQYFQSLVNSISTPDLQNQHSTRAQALATLTAQILNLMTPQQRQHLQDALNGYAADFEVLAKNASPPT